MDLLMRLRKRINSGKLGRIFYRKQEVEKTLENNEDSFKNLLEYLPVAVAILDKNENTEYANRKYRETIGYIDITNLSGWFLLAYPEKKYRKWVIKKWSADVEKALREGKEIEPSEYNVTCKDGKVRVMEISGTFVANKILAIFIDITDSVRVKGELIESEEKFRLLAENSVDCIWKLDTKLRFTYLSPSSETIMGFKPEQWVGTYLGSHFKKKEFLRVGAMAAKIIKNYKTFTNTTFETKMLNSKNEEVDLEITSRVLLNGEGKLIGIQGVTRAIAERKKAEKELSKYRDHLEELVKKRTKELEEKYKEVERMNNLFAGREFRIKELKNKIKNLEKKQKILE